MLSLWGGRGEERRGEGEEEGEERRGEGEEEERRGGEKGRGGERRGEGRGQCLVFLLSPLTDGEISKKWMVQFLGSRYVTSLSTASSGGCTEVRGKYIHAPSNYAVIII